MESPTLESTNNIEILFWISILENRWASGVSLWSDRKTIKLLEGRGWCYEAETQIVLAKRGASLVWESPWLQPGEDVKKQPQHGRHD